MLFIEGCMLIYDTRSPTAQPTQLNFPDGDKRPIIGKEVLSVNSQLDYQTELDELFNAILLSRKYPQYI